MDSFIFYTNNCIFVALNLTFSLLNRHIINIKLQPMKKLFLFVAMLLSFSLANAQEVPGGFDYSFGEYGFVFEELNNISVFMVGKGTTNIQSDGKIVTFTMHSETYAPGMLLMRHNTDGTIDTSYGNNGYVYLTPSNGSYYTFDSKIVENDNLLILAYYYSSAGGTMFLAKVDANGNLVPSFGNGGYVTFNKQANWTMVPRSLAIQEDGKILVGGEYGEFDYASCILRYTPNGQLDTSFANNGVFLNESYDSNGWQVMAAGESITLGQDGRIYLCGWFVSPNEEWGSPYDSKVVCVDQNGNLVSSFANGGVLEYSFSEVIDYINTAKVLEDGRLLIAGGAETYNEVQGNPIYSIFLAMINPDGSFDTSFGTNGITMVQGIPDCYNSVFNMDIANDGKIYTAGYVWQDLKDILVGAFNPDGTLVTEFGENGFDIISFGGNKHSCATDIAIQEDGKLVCVGHYEREETFVDYFLVRLNTETLIHELNPVENLTAEVNGGLVTLAWEAPQGEETVVSYNIYRNGSLIATDVTATTYEVTINTETTETFGVTAVYAFGESEIETVTVEIDLGINENASATVYTYPNPVVNEVHFSNLESDCTAVVYDMMGRVVMRAMVSAEGVMNVSQLNSGNYFVELINGSNVMKARFTK